MLATANNVKGLYRLNCDTIEQNTVNTAFSAFDIWHRRLGHICNDNLKKAEKSNSNIRIGKVRDSKCIVCVKGKQSRLQFKDIGNRAKQLLELVHSDVMGPLNQQSYSGMRYTGWFK